jgi:hypothetical protein
MSAAAEEALGAAWAAHQAAPEQLKQLAVDVCAKLGWANVQVRGCGVVCDVLHDFCVPFCIASRSFNSITLPIG